MKYIVIDQHGRQLEVTPKIELGQYDEPPPNLRWVQIGTRFPIRSHAECIASKLTGAQIPEVAEADE